MAAFGTLSPGEQADVPPNWLDQFAKYAFPFDWKGISLGSNNQAPGYKPGMKLSEMLTPEAVQQGIDVGMAASGGGLATKPPPLIGAYHGTMAEKEFSKFAPQAERSVSLATSPDKELGIHTSIDPSVSNAYASSYWAPEAMEAAGPRLKPVLVDARNALRFPKDAGPWGVPDRVIPYLEEAMRGGFVAPRGLLSDLYNAASGNWATDFIPTLQGRGIDSIFFPHPSLKEARHYKDLKYNSLMAFEPEQVIHRYSSEGQALAAERGIKEPIKAYDAGYWDERNAWKMPRGILAPGEERLPVGTEISTPQKLRMLKLNKAFDDLQAGKITMEEYNNMFK